jgi:outer membrane protein
MLLGELLPSVELTASFEDLFPRSGGQDVFPGSNVGGPNTDEIQTTTITGTVNVPLYQGGGPSAAVRQAKETNNQLKKEVEDARLSVHANVVSQWGVLQSTAAEIVSAQASVSANKIALIGVQEEEKVGQRTTLDVLNAQLELVTAQITLVTALRDRVVAEYSLYAAVGRMDAQTLGLQVPYYDPIEHYDLVKNKWFGLRPPAPPAPDE